MIVLASALLALLSLNSVVAELPLDKVTYRSTGNFKSIQDLAGQWQLYSLNPALSSAQRVGLVKRETLDDQCPPCFDCHLAKDPCLNSGTCSDKTGSCNCLNGFGGNNCGTPCEWYTIYQPVHINHFGQCCSDFAPKTVCDSLARGSGRTPRRPDEASCSCSDGWDGINCNGMGPIYQTSLGQKSIMRLSSLYKRWSL